MGKLTLPAEWAPQSFVILAWPYPEGDFGPWLEEVDHTYALISTAISKRQDVLILSRSPAHQKHIQDLLKRHAVFPAAIHFATLPYHDTWVRDTMPLTVWKTDQEHLDLADQQGLCHIQPELVDFGFNGWGGKYPSQLDNNLGTHLYHSGVFGSPPYHRVDWVLEGGSIETDGNGTLLATRSSILHPNRNPDPERAEAILKQTLGVDRFLWIDHGRLEGDDTDGHIDTLVRFCCQDTIAYQACGEASDPHFHSLRALARQLASFKTKEGKPYRLLPLPMPKPIYNEEGRRLPASYANFQIINEAVLIPQYEDPADELAISCLLGAFPDRQIIPIPARALIHEYGSIHCMCMQFPLPLKLHGRH